MTCHTAGMGYVLNAVIAAEVLLRQAVRDLPEAVVVPLAHDFAMVPMTDELFDSVSAGPSRSADDVFWKLPSGFGRVLAAWSNDGPVAYVEADIFGGAGTQTAQVWDGGAVVLGPLHLPEQKPFPPMGSPISQALRRLGAVKSQHFDEFEAVGLGRHRRMEDWLDLAD